MLKLPSDPRRNHLRRACIFQAPKKHITSQFCFKGVPIRRVNAWKPKKAGLDKGNSQFGGRPEIEPYPKRRPHSKHALTLGVNPELPGRRLCKIRFSFKEGLLSVVNNIARIRSDNVQC